MENVMPDPFDYDDMAAVATSLIEDFGRPMVLVTETSSGDAWNPTLAETTVQVIGVQTMFKAHEIDGSLIKQSDKKILIDSSVAPAQAMRIRDGDADYSIINVVEVAPGPRAVIYKLQVSV